MKKIIFITLSCCVFFQLSAQKRLIDTSAYGFKNQPEFGAPVLSNDAAFYAFLTTNKADAGKSTLTVKATNGDWTKQIIGGDNVCFDQDSHFVIFSKGKDSLCLLNLKDNREEYIANITSFKVFGNKTGSWLTYVLNTPVQEMVVRNLKTEEVRLFYGISDYQFNDVQSELYLQEKNSNGLAELQLLSLTDGTLRSIWKGINVSDLTFSPDGKKSSFIGLRDNNEGKSLWCYESGNQATTLVVSGLSKVFDEGTDIDGIISFNNLSDKLFFRILKHSVKPKANLSLPSVDIYNYKDPMLQSQQLKSSPRFSFSCVYNFKNQKVIQLENNNEEIRSEINDQQKLDFVLVIKKGFGDAHDEWNWNASSLTSVYLVSTNDGSKTCLAKSVSILTSGTYNLSPTGQYVVYYDPFKKNYFSYNTSSGKTKNITIATQTDWTSYVFHDEPDSAYAIEGIACWLKGDHAVLIKGRYDMFQIDPDGVHRAINLTDSYVANHHISFELAFPLNEIDGHRPIILRSFNQDTKDIGFCQIFPGKDAGLKFLSILHKAISYPPEKAKNADVYTITLESAECAPNIFLTTDFKTFRPLTDYHPEKLYNWVKSELVSWKSLDGSISHGILYKPENFDPGKKYPIIFHYYERKSDDLHKFIIPQFSDAGDIDIPTYVSNGYLVFLPDIHYKVGYPGRSAYNSVVGIAKFFSKLPWIDKTCMGLMGHSFGGFETNYIITHSNLFAAAVSLSGMSDFVSIYNSIIGNGSSRQKQYELYRDRIGATLWQRPDLYIQNSPIFKASQVTTPVLLMANDKDDDVPSAQGVEFFTALRRLNKKAWMLKYDNGGHQLLNNIDQVDLTIRMQQFFDYYLKGMLPAKWMTEGVQASMKQINSGLEYDTTGVKP